MAESGAEEFNATTQINETVLLILGVTGSGKSSFCNFILDEELCSNHFGLDSCTQEASKHTTTHRDRTLTLIDTAGFCDSERGDEDIYGELCRIGGMVDNGVDAVVLMVNSTERFSENQRNVMKQIEHLGGDIWNYTILVFSRENEVKMSIGKDNSSEYITNVLSNERCPPVLKIWMKHVNQRYMFVESQEKLHDNYRSEKLEELLDLVGEIKRANSGRNYSNHALERGRKFFTEKQIVNKEVDQATELYRCLVYELESNQNCWDKLKKEREEKAAKQLKNIKFKGKIANIELQLHQHRMSKSFRNEMKESAERIQQLEIQRLKVQQGDTV